MSAQPPTLGDVLTNIMNAITTILAEVSKAISDNAQVIASVLITGALVYAVWRVGSRFIPRITEFFGRLF